jgi:hypothetical protein
VAWLCSQVVAQIDAHPELQGQLPSRVARGIAAHHYVHLAVEAAVTETRGAACYLDFLAEHAPRHEPSEELLAELLFRTEVMRGLDTKTGGAMEAAIDGVMRQAPEARNSNAGKATTTVVDLVNAGLSLEMPLAGFQFRDSNRSLPEYLVLEPHLPDPLATSIREALLG